ncbi:MAG: four helix bundle protein [Bacteroidales bacterium]|jgi:four helix bundle protein|nr:four helix bundle protein [Bacteroidales bacterium]
MRPFEKLEVWQQSMRLVKAIYDLTKDFPKDEIYGLTSQMRRAAVSIPSNIAEGSARAGRKEYAYFINIAKGSLAELDTQLKIAVMLGYSSEKEEINENIDHLGRLLTGLFNKWNKE